ncbi:MAG: hypothetical protein BWY31_00745 [Lentisphaerae bacterium ADurb.Bin242]|nr:MAG: hypothetical protein BWY31_00745 [Lentisphaerae bacterium ADurb.Bin242]
MKKLLVALFLLFSSVFFLLQQLKANAARESLTTAVNETEAARAVAVIETMFKAGLDRNIEAMRKCWIAGLSDSDIAVEIRKLPPTACQFILLDARRLQGRPDEIWLTGTVDRSGNGCTFILTGNSGRDDYRIKAVSTLEDALTRQTAVSKSRPHSR